MAGLSMRARTMPKTPAKSEVTKYQPMTEPPRRPNFESGRLAAPMMREKKMMGMTTIFSMAMRMVPKGETKETMAFTVSLLPAWEQAKPATMPMTNAQSTRQTRGMSK